MSLLPLVVITTYRDAECLGRTLEDTRTFKDARTAGAWIAEEVLWEDTIRCRCPALGIEVEGSFRRFHE